jgi:hypothetical protein
MASSWFQVSVTGARSCVAANQLRSGGRKRTERCIAKVRHLYRDLDTDCDTRLTPLRASEALLKPTAVISTSPGKYQVRWLSPFERQESTLKSLCIAFGRDPVCTNVSRIHGQHGYLSCKYDTTYSITVEYTSDSSWNPDDFRLDIAAANAILLSCSIPSQKHSGRHTSSDHDWAWLRHDFAHGNGAAERSPRKLVAGVESNGFCTRIEGAIPHSISRWCRHVASHRKNFDTPPLRGCCKALRGRSRATRSE